MRKHHPFPTLLGAGVRLEAGGERGPGAEEGGGAAHLSRGVADGGVVRDADDRPDEGHGDALRGRGHALVISEKEERPGQRTGDSFFKGVSRFFASGLTPTPLPLGGPLH